MVGRMAEIGDVKTEDEDVDGQERRSPEIECRKDLSDVWLCASLRTS